MLFLVSFIARNAAVYNSMIQAYLIHQIVYVSWNEFQDQLSHVKDLESLRKCHDEYLDKVIQRSLLNEKANPILSHIRKILSLIEAYHQQLKMSSELTHTIQKIQLEFRQSTKFLFTVLQTFKSKRQTSHFDELVLRLNFNGYFENITINSTDTK